MGLRTHAGQIPLGGMKFSEEMAFVELTAEAPPWGVEVDVMQLWPDATSLYFT